MPSISDWYNPTYDDYIALDNYLKYGERPELDLTIERFLDGSIINTIRRDRIRHFSLINPTTTQIPTLQVDAINTTLDDRTYCIITYFSDNAPYNQFLEPFIRCLKESGFQGHLLHQKGGWPYVLGGGLHCVDVPYAFKPCMFKEALRLGYRYVIWLDISCRVHTSLDPLFQLIKNKGAFFFLDPLQFDYPAYTYSLKHLSHITQALGTSWNVMKRVRHLKACAFGLDLHARKHIDFVNSWYQLALEKNSFYNCAPEQIPMSYLAHRLGIIGKIFEGHRTSEYFSISAHD